MASLTLIFIRLNLEVKISVKEATHMGFYHKVSHNAVETYRVLFDSFKSDSFQLTHWGRVTHICVVKLTIIGSDNGLSPGRRQVIILTNAGILLIGPLGTNFSEMLSEIQTSSLKKTRLKLSSAKCCPFRLGLNVLNLALLVNYKKAAADKTGPYTDQSVPSSL